MLQIEDLLIENNFLTEKVYSPTTAIAYHRTDVEDFIDIIKKEGFQPGSGDFYGKGLYCTYELESQLNERMRNTYGPYIIKYKIPIENYIIFDRDHARQIFGQDHSDVTEQLKRFIPSNTVFPNPAITSLLHNKELVRKYGSVFKALGKLKKVYTPIAILPFYEVYKEIDKKSPDVWYSAIPQLYNLFYDFINTFYKKQIQSKIYGDSLHLLNWQIVDDKKLKTYLYDFDKSFNMFMDATKEKDNTFVDDLYLVVSIINPVHKALKQIDQLEETFYNSTYTSDFAKASWKLIQDNFPNVEGIILTGKGDGKVLVAYNWDECVPLAVYEEKKAGSQIIKGYTIPITNNLIDKVKDNFKKIIEMPFLGNEEQKNLEEEYNKITTIKNLSEKEIEDCLYNVTRVENLLFYYSYRIQNTSPWKLIVTETMLQLLSLNIIRETIVSKFSSQKENIDIFVTEFLFNSSYYNTFLKPIFKKVGFNPAEDVIEVKEGELQEVAKSSSEVLNFFINRAKQVKQYK